MKILISGANGYIGGQLATYLSKNKADYSLRLACRNINSSTVPKLSNTEVVEIKLDNKENLEKICKDVDLVIHLAGMNAKQCIDNPEKANEVNVDGTENILNAAVKNGLKRFVYLSSIHVYNSTQLDNLIEESDRKSSHPYALSKIAAEDIVLSANKKNDIEVVVIRLSNAIGVPHHPDVNCWMLLANDLCYQAVHHNKLILRESSGKEVRNFISMSETINAIEHLVNLPKEKLGNGIFNVGVNESMTLLEMSKLIRKRFLYYSDNFPKIFINSGYKNKIKPSNFVIDKLHLSGFAERDNNFDNEIDNLINFCSYNKIKPFKFNKYKEAELIEFSGKSEHKIMPLESENQANGLVSIVMTCFNGERFLKDALESVLAQTYQNWELLFWDNQSTDSSAEIFKSYDDNRFKYFYAKKHSIISVARNCCIQEANGEFICFLDVDDTWLENKLEDQISVFSDREIGFSCGNYILNNEYKNKTKVALNNLKINEWALDDLLKNYFAALVTLMVRRSELEDLPYICNESYHIISDFDLVIRLSLKSKIGFIARPIAMLRIHQTNETTVNMLRHFSELELWFKWAQNRTNIRNSSGFVYRKYWYEYVKAIYKILSNDRKHAFLLFKKLPWSIWKVRLLLALLMPVSVINALRS